MKKIQIREGLSADINQSGVELVSISDDRKDVHRIALTRAELEKIMKEMESVQHNKKYA